MPRNFTEPPLNCRLASWWEQLPTWMRSQQCALKKFYKKHHRGHNTHGLVYYVHVYASTTQVHACARACTHTHHRHTHTVLTSSLSTRAAFPLSLISPVTLPWEFISSLAERGKVASWYRAYGAKLLCFYKGLKKKKQPN